MTYPKSVEKLGFMKKHQVWGQKGRGAGRPGHGGGLGRGVGKAPFPTGAQMYGAWVCVGGLRGSILIMLTPSATQAERQGPAHRPEARGPASLPWPQPPAPLPLYCPASSGAGLPTAPLP